MLVVPFAAGLLLRTHDGQASGLWVVALFAFWIIGYLAFNATSAWLKAPAARRLPLVAPMLTYAAASGCFGLLTLAGVGPRILLWAPAFAVLMAPALVLASRRRERAVVGGALTTAAASAMPLVVRFPDPAALLAPSASGWHAALVAAGVFAYFFGTVLYVKTNIRERGSRAFYRASVGWHVAAALAAALLTTRGTPPAWVAFFAATAARAAIVPRLRPVPSPMRIGLVEVGFSSALLAIVALA